MKRPLTIEDANKEQKAADSVRRAMAVKEWLLVIALLVMIVEFGLLMLGQLVDVLIKLGVL